MPKEKRTKARAMSCMGLETNLVDFLDGSLDQQVSMKQEITEHLAECEQCREMVEDAKCGIAALDSLHDVPLPTAIIDRCIDEAMKHLAIGNVVAHECITEPNSVVSSRKHP